MRIAAAVKWYELGDISQVNPAISAGLTRFGKERITSIEFGTKKFRLCRYC